MGKALLLMAAVVLLVYALFDVLATPKDRVRYLPKVAWAVVIVLLPYVGALLWMFFGTLKDRPSGQNRQSRPRPTGPDDDPDFLRGL
ncbi:MAG TPA: PLD nuclease N-terminal domain-containing protein [Aeromicrobium sp.]|nr:PLD nuclease N-terminal domain-containing protein [Aeromicrobium sp.]